MLLSRDNSNLIRCDNTDEVFGEAPSPEVSSLGWYRSGEVYNAGGRLDKKYTLAARCTRDIEKPFAK